MIRVKNDVYPLLRLVLPLALTGLIQSTIWFFGTMFLAHLGADILAAGSLVSWLFGTLVVVIVGTLSSINILVALKFGAKDEQAIWEVVRDGLWLAVLFSIPTFLLIWNISPLFILFGQTPTIVQLAQPYLHSLAPGILPNLILIALLEVLMGLGQARLILFCSIMSVSLTIFFSFAFIFGKFGFANLGIAGAGWGLTLSNWITLFVLASFLFTNKEYRGYFRLIIKPTKSNYLVELLKIGIPMGLMFCVEVAFFFALTLIMGSFGSLVMAANQIAFQYLGSLMAVIFSLAQAITVRMGHLLGAGKRNAAVRSAYVAVSFSILFMLITALGYWLFSIQLISLDFDVHAPENKQIIDFARQFLMVCAIFQIVEAIRITLFGTLRALKDTQFTLIISIISFWGISFPLGYLLAFNFELGPIGFWWGMVIGASTSVLLLFWRFKSKIAV
ncbi:MAG: MATE family efflux transporter [Tatlockia sp.]|nr:MATE family efflux transporter [Tatlockia sp.]